MSEIEIESSFYVFDNSEGVSLNIRESPDFPDLILICTETEKDKEWYGNVRLTLTKDHALKLAEAIKLQVNTMDNLKGVNRNVEFD